MAQPRWVINIIVLAMCISYHTNSYCAYHLCTVHVQYEISGGVSLIFDSIQFSNFRSQILILLLGLAIAKWLCELTACLPLYLWAIFDGWKDCRHGLGCACPFAQSRDLVCFVYLNQVVIDYGVTNQNFPHLISKYFCLLRHRNNSKGTIIDKETQMLGDEEWK